MGEAKETNVKSMRRFWGGLRGQAKSHESVGTDTTTSASSPAAEDDSIPLIERIKMDMAASSSSLGKRSTATNNSNVPSTPAADTVHESFSEQSSNTSWMNEESHSLLSLVGTKSVTRAPRASSKEDSFNEEEVMPRGYSLKKKLVKVKRTAGSACSVDGSVDVSVISAMKMAGKTKISARELKRNGVDIPAQRGRKSREESDKRRSKSRARDDNKKERSKSRARDGGASPDRGRDADRKSRSKSIGRARSRSRARPRSSSNSVPDEDGTQVLPIEIRPKSPSTEKLSVKERAQNFEEKGRVSRTSEKTKITTTPSLNDSVSRGRDATDKTTRRSRSVHRSAEQDDAECSSPEKSSRGRDATEKTTRRSRSVHRSAEQDDAECSSPGKVSRGKDATEKAAQRSRSVHRRTIQQDDAEPEKASRRSRSVHRRTIEQDEAEYSSPEKASRRSRSVHRRTIEQDDPKSSQGKNVGEKSPRRSRSVHRRSVGHDDRDSDSPDKTLRGKESTEKSPRRSKSVRRRSIDVHASDSPTKSSRGRDSTEKPAQRSRSVHRRSISQDDPECDSPKKSSRSKDEGEKTPRRSKSVHRRSIGQNDSGAESALRQSFSSEKSSRRKSVGSNKLSSPRRSVASPEKSPRQRPKPKPEENDEESYSDESLPPVPTQIVIRPDQDDEIDEDKETSQQINGDSDEIYNKIKHAGITQEQFLALTQAGLTITNEG